MNRVTLLLVMLLTCSLFASAQNYTSHYESLRSISFEDYTPLRVQLYVDNVLQSGTRYEIGAYCGEQVRGCAFPNDNKSATVYNLALYGQTGDQFTFRLYDHQADAESTMSCPSAFTTTDLAGLYLTEPFALHFYTARMLTFTGSVSDDWDILSNWQDAASLPGEHDRVIIAADCTLGSATSVASVKVNADAKLSLEATLTATETCIEDGGQLRFKEGGGLSGVFYMKKYIRAFDGNQNNYYLVSSPLVSSSVDPMLMRMQMHQREYGDNAFDLYAFDESQVEEEWQNFKTTPFEMSQGEGYLYEYEDGTVIVFQGTPNNDASTTYDLDKPHYGYNLVGNPFPCNAVVTSNKVTTQFATLNANRDGFQRITDTPIVVPPCTAIFVRAREDGATVTFTAE